jgi:hypothetical protein
MKKYISYISLGTVAIAAILALLGLFGVAVFEGVMSKILFTDIAFAVVSVLLIDTIELAAKKNIIAIISTALLCVSLLLFLGVIWLNAPIFDDYGQITVVVSLASTEFSIIVGHIVKLGKKCMALQVITYAILTFVIGVVCFAILGMGSLEIFLSVWYWAAVIIAIALSIALKVFAKKVAADNMQAKVIKDGYIQVKEAEYNAVLAENAELKRKLAEYEAANK